MNKKGVSVTIGVILMIAITVAIASTVYVYVSGMIQHDSEISEEGNITQKWKGNYDSQVIYYFELDNIKDVEVEKEIYFSYEIGDYYMEE